MQRHLYESIDAVLISPNKNADAKIKKKSFLQSGYLMSQISHLISPV
jgi:hypothetical protein